VLQPVQSEATIKAPVPQKPTITSELKDVPRWPISPRLKSPPPINRPLAAPRKIELELPAINVQRSAPLETEQINEETDEEESLSVPGMRVPARGASGASSTLETVQEISQPNTPSNGLEEYSEKRGDDGSGPREQDNPIDLAFGKNRSPKTNTSTNESGSDSGGKGEIKLRSTSAGPAASATRPNAVLSAKLYSTTGAGRGKPSTEASAQNMTVETETVSSIPQVAVGGGAGVNGVNGSLRAKPSSETIRPKKEKRKLTRKAPSVTSGTGEPPDSYPRRRLHHHHSTRSLTDRIPSRSSERPESSESTTTRGQAGPCSPERGPRRSSLTYYNVGSLLTKPSRSASSKADIFEAKIASAVDEANSSDSEETFVYESNPPEASDRPRRFHSRTPSATSMVSQVDLRGNIRSLHGVMDGVHSVALKKSMKFASSYNGNPPEAGAVEDDGRGTTRSNVGTGRGTTHHHHIGRWGRNGGNGHPSLFDNESPFSNVAKSKLGGTTPRHSSGPTSPKVSKFMTGKKGSQFPLVYDIDDGAGADDERTPLISSTIRSSRSTRNRRPGSSMRRLEHQAYRQNRSWLSRFAGCLLLSLLILLVVSGAIGFLFATTQPLSDVRIMGIKNVLVSQQELMLDLEVSARNPNVVVVSIDSMNIEVFARSKHAGTDSEWWRKPPDDRMRRRRLRSNDLGKRDDDPADPPDFDDPDKKQTLKLGEIFEFDSPLTFEGSPFKDTPSKSIGSLRLSKPGNATIPAGTERWERVIKYGFELRCKGVLKYQLPLSQRMRTASVDYSITVKPSEQVVPEDGHLPAPIGEIHVAI
jgi:hypothetical protein